MPPALAVLAAVAAAALAAPAAAPEAPPLYKGDAAKGEIELVKPVSVFENRWILFYNDEVVFPNGKKGTYNRVSRPKMTPERVGGAAMLALTEDGRVLVERYFRHPLRRWTLELPRGGWEPGETLEGTAARELLEETGYSCARTEPLGRVAPDTGLTDYTVALFLLRGCKAGTGGTEKEESLKVELKPWAEVLALARDGTIEDSISLAAILRAEPRLAAPKP